jgi:hypothetical protein
MKILLKTFSFLFFSKTRNHFLPELEFPFDKNFELQDKNNSYLLSNYYSNKDDYKLCDLLEQIKYSKNYFSN